LLFGLFRLGYGDGFSLPSILSLGTSYGSLCSAVGGQYMAVLMTSQHNS